MAQSAIDVCNIALSALGEGRIESIVDPQSTNEEQCAVNLPVAVGVAMAAREWTFATEWLKLEAAAAQAGVHPLDTKRWLLPADVLRVLKVDDGSGYGIECKVEGRFVYAEPGNLVDAFGVTVSKPLYIRAIRRKDNPAEWSPAFVLACGYLLASLLAVPITDSTKQRDDLYKVYQFQLREAAALDGMQGTPERPQNSPALPSLVRG